MNSVRRNPAEWNSLEEYFLQRKRFVLTLMLAAEFVVNYSYRNVLLGVLHNHAQVFWEWSMPYNVAIKLGFLGLILARGRRANTIGLFAMVLLFLLPYWHHV